MEAEIRANAELVRKVARDDLNVDAKYDESGVRWLDQYIDGQRENNPTRPSKIACQAPSDRFSVSAFALRMAVTGSRSESGLGGEDE